MKPPRNAPQLAAIVFASSLTLAMAPWVSGCRSEAPVYAQGIVEMGVLYIGVLDKEFDRALLTDPTARARVRSERAAAALDRLERAVRDDPEDPALQYRLGMALLQSDRLEEAAGRFRLAASLDPEDPRPRRGLSRALERADELGKPLPN